MSTDTSSPKAGDPAPEVSLPDVRGGRVELSQLLARARVVLVFYRGGWCPICNRQLAKLSSEYEAFQARAAEIVAISNEEVREGAEVLKKIGPPFPLLLDGTSEVIERYGLLVGKRDPLGWMLRKRAYARPAVFVVERDGTVSWTYVGTTYRDRPSVARILDALDRGGAARAAG